MPATPKIELTDKERQRLIAWTKNPPKPYLRRRARAILRVAGGEPIYKVALTLRPVANRQTVSEWVHHFLAKRLEGLKVAPGRGRKPSFFPPGEAGGSDPD